MKIGYILDCNLSNHSGFLFFLFLSTIQHLFCNDKFHYHYEEYNRHGQINLNNFFCLFFTSLQVGTLNCHYLFSHNHVSKRSADYSHQHHRLLANDEQVNFVVVVVFVYFEIIWISYLKNFFSTWKNEMLIFSVLFSCSISQMMMIPI